MNFLLGFLSTGGIPPKCISDHGHIGRPWSSIPGRGCLSLDASLIQDTGKRLAKLGLESMIITAIGLAGERLTANYIKESTGKPLLISNAGT